MTDDEMIKFIDHAINSAKSEDGFKEIYWEKLEYILDFINRQQEKIKAFDEKLVIQQGLIDYQKAEIERLKKEDEDKERAYNDEFCLRKEWQSKCRELLKDKQATKSKAIKEFAERLKEKCYEDFQETYEMLSPYVTDDDIDNLVKEMTEVETNQRKEDEKNG